MSSCVIYYLWCIFTYLRWLTKMWIHKSAWGKKNSNMFYYQIFNQIKFLWAAVMHNVEIQRYKLCYWYESLSIIFVGFESLIRRKLHKAPNRETHSKYSKSNLKNLRILTLHMIEFKQTNTWKQSVIKYVWNIWDHMDPAGSSIM